MDHLVTQATSDTKHRTKAYTIKIKKHNTEDLC